MPLKHYKQLDGIRAVAALMVMLYHFFVQLPPGPVVNDFLKKISPFGQTGVILFFVLSGFLITRILLATKEDQRYFKNFYVRRALRIFPLYYLYLLIELVLVPALSGAPVPLKNSGYFWVYLQNFAFTFGWPVNGPNHYWSLAVEEHFYLFWPLIVYFCNERTLKKVSAGLIVLSFLCRLLFLYNGYGSGVYFTLTNMDALAIGALTALTEREGGFKRTADYYLRGFLALLVPLALLNWFVSGQRLDAVQLFKLPVTAFAYFFLLVHVITLKNRVFLFRLLTGKPLAYLGKISYGLYVFHPFCFSYGAKIIRSGSWPVNMVLQFALTVIVASLSFYYFESAFLRRKKFFAYDGPTRGGRKTDTTARTNPLSERV